MRLFCVPGLDGVFFFIFLFFYFFFIWRTKIMFGRCIGRIVFERNIFNLEQFLAKRPHKDDGF